MKTQSETKHVLREASHEMLLRLLQIAEILNKGIHDGQRPMADKTHSTFASVENECK